MIIDGTVFDDDLSCLDSLEDLWRSVLMAAVEDAVFGCFNRTSGAIAANREARDYILKPNKDFELVCTFAGCDPCAVREHVSRMIEQAPTVEELATAKQRKGRRRAGSLQTFQGPRGPARGAPHKRHRI